jgi:hypothetical protein
MPPWDEPVTRDLIMQVVRDLATARALRRELPDGSPDQAMVRRRVVDLEDELTHLLDVRPPA